MTWNEPSRPPGGTFRFLGAESKGTPIFGGFDNKADAPAEDAQAPTLTVDTTALSGGAEVKHEK